jgi:hypothetical protein
MSQNNSALWPKHLEECGGGSEKWRFYSCGSKEKKIFVLDISS